MNDDIKKLIDEFKGKIELWKGICPNEKFVFNEDLEDTNINWNKIKYIVVADNPGVKEKEVNKYLVSAENNAGSSGNIAEKIFDYLGIKKNEQFIVLNKCPIFTKETKDLKGKCLLQETQEYMAELTFNLHKSLCELHEQNAPKPKVYIFGLGGCHDSEKGWLARKKDGDYCANQTMRFYFEKIKELYSNETGLQISLFIMKHFSRWQIFRDLLYVTENDSQGKIISREKVSLSMLEEKKIDSKELINALENLEYKEELFNV